jgi:hypothetical protein
MQRVDKRTILHLMKFDKCKSNEQIIEVLTTALQYARMNEVYDIDINMKSDAGAFHCSGSTARSQPTPPKAPA